MGIPEERSEWSISLGRGADHTGGGGAVQISLGFDEASVRADAGPLGELTCLWAGERVLQGAGVRALTSCSVL